MLETVGQIPEAMSNDPRLKIVRRVSKLMDEEFAIGKQIKKLCLDFWWHSHWSPHRYHSSKKSKDDGYA